MLLVRRTGASWYISRSFRVIGQNGKPRGSRSMGGLRYVYITLTSYGYLLAIDRILVYGRA